MSTLRLTRSRQDVQSFLSVLGGLRETRLTAVLGYLVSRFSKEFETLLGFDMSPADETYVVQYQSTISGELGQHRKKNCCRAPQRSGATTV